MSRFAFIFSLLSLALHLQLFPGDATTFTITNNCDYTIWPGILSNAGVAPLPTTGFSLEKGQSKPITPPSGWAGRFWARTLCSTDSSGKLTCRTGDCGSGKLDCSGAGATPPSTLAEFTLSGAGGLDFYDVSLVDGYNLPVLVGPHGGGRGPNCSFTGCVGDLNGACPSELRVAREDGGSTVACRSACDAFNSPEYCCSGAYGSPDTCKPSSYSMVFKKACPSAYSYAYDDKSSTFTCGGSPDYTITFCPSPSTSQKAASSEGQGPPSSSSPSSSSSSSSDMIMNSSMVYEGALDAYESSSPSTTTHVLRPQLIAGGIAILTALCRLLQLF